MIKPTINLFFVIILIIKVSHAVCNIQHHKNLLCCFDTLMVVLIYDFQSEEQSQRIKVLLRYILVSFHVFGFDFNFLLPLFVFYPLVQKFHGK